MKTQKQVVHFEAKKGFTTAQSNEHLRNWTEKGWGSANANGRIDRSRQHLNFQIGRGGMVQRIDKSKSIPMLLDARLKELGIADPNAGLEEPRYRTVADFIISGTHEQLHKLAFGDQKVRMDFADCNGKVDDPEHNGINAHLVRKPEIEQWAKDMYDLMCARYGEENVLSFVVHCDETTPHIHANIVPVVDGKLSFKKLFCGANKYEYRQRTLELHDAFAEVNKKWGLERGDSVNITKAKHRTTEEYRRELSSECSTLERKVEEKSATLKDLNQQIRQAEIKMKGLTTMVRNLEESRVAIEQELDSIRDSLSDDGIDEIQRASLSRKEISLQKKLSDILGKLSDKQAKLAQAGEQLNRLNKQLYDAKMESEMLNREVQSARADVSQIALNKISSEALWGVLNEFVRIKPGISPVFADYLEDSLLEDMSQKGMNIIACAALLSMGMVDQATEFAKNCGGNGGAGSNGGWGRDPKEDEQEWLRRCLAQSRKMMRPSGQKLKR